ncbi:hypothetical protein SRHO_G00301920 [Serrasalmus rhombeus]
MGALSVSALPLWQASVGHKRWFKGVLFIILAVRSSWAVSRLTHSHLPPCHLPARDHGANSHTVARTQAALQQPPVLPSLRFAH